MLPCGSNPACSPPSSSRNKSKRASSGCIVHNETQASAHMTQVEKRWPERSYFLLSQRHVARVVRRDCLHETVSAVRWLGIAHSETHGFRATRRSLAALPLKVESRYFRTNVSLLVSYPVLSKCYQVRMETLVSIHARFSGVTRWTVYGAVCPGADVVRRCYGVCGPPQ